MRRALTAGFVMLILASPSAAQEHKAFELGVDGMIAYRATTPSSTTVTLPVGRMRVGYFLAPNFSFEPSLSYNSSDGNGSHSSRTTIGVAIVPQFAAIGNSKVYARPFVEYNFITSTFENQRITSQASSVGAGVGVRVPLANRLMWRLEAAYANSTGESQFMGLVGLSFFTN
jgi:Outer membrane protein beta-barrel domain